MTGDHEFLAFRFGASIRRRPVDRVQRTATRAMPAPEKFMFRKTMRIAVVLGRIVGIFPSGGYTTRNEPDTAHAAGVAAAAIA